MKTRTVGVIIGGAKAQHGINTAHSRDICDALRSAGFQVTEYHLSREEEVAKLIADHRSGKLDIVFNNAAGPRGGDGSVEGLLEVAGVPYVGSDSHATACAYDKQTTKTLVANAGVRVIPGFTVSRESYDTSSINERIVAELGYPVVVKAVRGSDSIGVSLVHSSEHLADALRLAFTQDQEALIERFIKRSADITCMVLGTGQGAEALIPAESLFDADIYTNDLVTETILRVPEVDPAITREITENSLRAHRALKCADYSRSDFLVDEQGSVYFLEINAHAGLGKESCTAFITSTTKGWTYEQSIVELLNLSLNRQGLA